MGWAEQRTEKVNAEKEEKDEEKFSFLYFTFIFVSIFYFLLSSFYIPLYFKGFLISSFLSNFSYSLHSVFVFLFVYSFCNFYILSLNLFSISDS